MKPAAGFIVAAATFYAVNSVAVCTTDLFLAEQFSWAWKNDISWKIDNKSPYAKKNGYNIMLLNYANACQLLDDNLQINLSLYGLAFHALYEEGAFEQNNRHARMIADKLSFSYAISDSFSIEFGKLRPTAGLFYLQSPASLIKNYNTGFKAEHIYTTGTEQAWQESFWGAVFTKNAETWSLSFTFSPKLTTPGERYLSSENWSATARSNTSDRYLLSWSDYHAKNFTPSAHLMLGEGASAAAAVSILASPQLTVNTSLAGHSREQWRHLERKKADLVQSYNFPEELYARKHRAGMEFAFGLHYSSENFNQYGMEYYFQSEGYSSKEWRKQYELSRFLNKKTFYAPLDNAFDSYKYLMASEINNVVARGQLTGKHYLNIYSAFITNSHAVLRPYAVLNLQDKSSLLGVNYNLPLGQLDSKLIFYSGAYASAGSAASEFCYFGKTVGIYTGIKYHF